MNSKPKIGTVVEVKKSGNRFNAWDKDGNKWTHAVITSTRKKAYNNKTALELREKNGRTYWWQVPLSEFGKTSHVPTPASDIEVPEGHDETITEHVVGHQGGPIARSQVSRPLGVGRWGRWQCTFLLLFV